MTTATAPAMPTSGAGPDDQTRPQPGAQSGPQPGPQHRRPAAGPGEPPRPLVGPLLLGIGALHLGVGVLVHAEPLADMVRAGVLDTLRTDPGAVAEREAAYWFELAGLGMLLLGSLALDVERRAQPLPTSLASGLLGMAAVGIAVEPRTGFWAFLVPAAVVVVRARRAGVPDRT